MINRHYRGEAEKDRFYRIPKMLFQNPRYKYMSTDAKVLYGRMLDRMGLSSTREGWIDKDGSVFIHYQQKDAMEELNVKGKEKIVKLYNELEKAELIERVKQGFGKPDKIYVGKVEIYPAPDTVETPEFENRNSGKNAAARGSKIETPEFENRNQSVSIFETLPNDTEISETDSVIRQAEGTATNHTETASKARLICQEEAEKLIGRQIDWNALYDQYPQKKAYIETITAIMTDEVSSDAARTTVSGATRTRAEIRERLAKVTTEDVAGILDKLNGTRAAAKYGKDISNLHGYLLTCLYNAPASRAPGKNQNEYDKQIHKYAQELKERSEAKAQKAAKADEKPKEKPKTYLIKYAWRNQWNQWALKCGDRIPEPLQKTFTDIKALHSFREKLEEEGANIISIEEIA